MLLSRSQNRDYQPLVILVTALTVIPLAAWVFFPHRRAGCIWCPQGKSDGSIYAVKHPSVITLSDLARCEIIVSLLDPLTVLRSQLLARTHEPLHRLPFRRIFLSGTPHEVHLPGLGLNDGVV